MDWGKLRTFYSVAKAGSFTHAVQTECHTVSPTLCSEYVSLFGVPLG